jgi:hypothetical protein
MKRRLLMTIALLAGCTTHSGRYPSTAEGSGVCDYYGRYGPRSSYYYAPGYNYGRPQGPNDHPYLYGGGPTLGYGGGPAPASCPRD